MPRAEKPELARWIYRQVFDRPVQIKEVLARGAKEVLGKPTADADAYAEANANQFCNYLLAQEEENHKRGLSRCFEVLDDSGRILSWYGVGNITSSFATSEMRMRARLRHRPAILKMIDTLDDREYEALGCVVSKIGGATEVMLTPKGGEGGVDFFACVLSPGLCHLFGGGIHPLRIIGQCKKYMSRVNVERVGTFITTMQDVRHRGERKIETIVPTWFQAAKGPIIGLIISHSGFQSGAETKARNHGIITAETLDLAEIVARSRRLPESLDADARAQLCRERVIEMVRKN